MSICAELAWRGLIHQSTDETGLADWLNAEMRTVYAGFDPTADSIHAGNLVPLMMLRRFQQAGHRPIVLVGGATGMIGDPTGKSEERNLLSVDQLRKNVAGIGSVLEQFVDFDCGANSAVLVNNFDWIRTFSYLDFLRDVGKNFPVGVMLAKESVKNRLASETGISYTEFSYMLLQAYDFVHLFREFGCQLQIGGSDQWGNITAGIDLGRRMESAQLYGMTCPLLLTSDGRKMGKTEKGSVWLSADKTGPYEFYQYWVNVADADVSVCLRMLTELPQETIDELDVQRERDASDRASQKKLAEALTLLVHGEAGLAIAQRATDIFFGAEISDLSDEQLGQIFADVPSQQLERSQLEGAGLNVIDALVAAKLAKSKGEARRTISQGGAYVNNRRVESIETQLSSENLASETVMVLRSGKKRYALLRFA